MEQPPASLLPYCGYSTFDTANGPGVRVSLFVSGCTMHCKGCFNPESWDFKAGKVFTEETMEKLLKDCDDPCIAGLSILGGDPFEPQNQAAVLAIVEKFRKKFGNRKSIWIWSGRKFEKLNEQGTARMIIRHCDALVDGPFIEHLKVKEKGKWYGSTNQRIIEIKRR